MEKAKVYFTDFHTEAFGDGLPTKLKKLAKHAGIGQIDMDGRFVAIKLHFGELGNV
ncbi:MAG TPA: 4Fe-4S ferredoxin, partial [Candidatus Rifleibacterium sp.]|nr:4Fe-4S ferredoxin [Candidatus Rifleibacterium sp.]